MSEALIVRLRKKITTSWVSVFRRATDITGTKMFGVISNPPNMLRSIEPRSGFYKLTSLERYRRDIRI